MYKLNFLQNPVVQNITLSKDIALEPLKSNEKVEDFIKSLKAKFSFSSLNTFSFTKDGFFYQ